MTPREALIGDPSRFAFDAAVRILVHMAQTPDPAGAAQFVSSPDLAYPGAEVRSVGPATPRPRVQTNVMSMTGPSGVLPRGYTELVTATARDRSPSLQAFLDMLADRFVAQFAQAGSKYRIHRAAEEAALGGGGDRFGHVLLALTGFATADLASRLRAGEAALQHYAGYFAARPRSADRLEAMASDWLGRPVRVQQFAGAWLALPAAERTALPHGNDLTGFNRLGIDAALGVRAWDQQSRVVLEVGPLDRAEFETLLPGSDALSNLCALVRAYVGFEIAFAIRPILRRDAVPPLQLDAEQPAPPRLGWNSWLTAPAPSRTADAADALFEVEET
nr:type VI secretion system baseplate subunit TssG [uncultured Lichenicoccus sp.]